MKKIKVGLIIDEYFGGAGTAFGGYGFLARRYIAKYLPNEHIQVDVLLGKSKSHYALEHHIIDNIDVYRLPRRKWFAKRWLKKQNYDIYLSIELAYRYILELDIDKKLIFWIQDPRPMYEWDEINTVTLFPETSYYNQKLYDFIHKIYLENRIKFITQGFFLNQKAKDLYKLADETEITYLPNPVDIDYNFDLMTHKKENMIIFLGRIESVKRGWLFCEIAKKMPEYQFYMLGQTFREADKNSVIMAPYINGNIPNLHFPGHVDGIEKENFLKNAKILVNTSIHEALPISFLEALAYGTLLVSNRNPENLTSTFGIHVGDVLGDGFDKVELYVNAIRHLMENDEHRLALGKQAIEYVKSVHNVEKCINDLRTLIHKEVKK
ncbi:glycosyltransferase family 4 protein [Conservatibacter flavescens]|uniref:Glycosyl transferase family 1 domain-containing protein n=1 Tax=Conservatibacter flavescens TaxID=28161 RepID=A0A2M8S3E0_9PAST|nr:glycosyltransferase family 4 protein [Conservatibacter flavescens]PJG85669.1 hypothetical protein CVP05_04760 [Conservatibacter flavescens]